MPPERMLPPGLDPRMLMQHQPQRPPTIREQLQSTIDKSEKAKELIKMLDAHPEIEEFLRQIQFS